jgi:hypothetical protein
MKKVVLALFFLAALCSAKAQDDEGGKNAVKINPLSILVATANVSYERATAEKQSCQLGAFYTGVKISGTKYSGFGITPEYRFYVGGHKQVMDGLYLAPFLRYQHLKWEQTDTKDNFTYSSVGGGALLGWETTMDDLFVVDLFIGPSINSGTAKSTTATGSDQVSVAGAFKGFAVRAGINFGFRF